MALGARAGCSEVRARCVPVSATPERFGAVPSGRRGKSETGPNAALLRAIQRRGRDSNPREL